MRSGLEVFSETKKFSFEGPDGAKLLWQNWILSSETYIQQPSLGSSQRQVGMDFNKRRELAVLVGIINE